jgi:rhamnosyltransferase
MITFVIRSKNEERWIGHCLQSIVDKFEKDEVEIKVVDNESKDDTLQVVKMFKRDYNIEIMTIEKTKYTPGKSLNLGISAASKNSDFACLMSAHCVLGDINHDALNKHFEDSNCFGVIGRQIPVYKGKRLLSKYVWENFKGSERSVIKNLRENIEGSPPFFHNAFSFINLEVWNKHPFDEKVTGKEDRLWANQLLEKDYYSLYDPSQNCIHHWTAKCATWSGLE